MNKLAIISKSSQSLTELYNSKPFGTLGKLKRDNPNEIKALFKAELVRVVVMHGAKSHWDETAIQLCWEAVNELEGIDNICPAALVKILRAIAGNKLRINPMANLTPAEVVGVVKNEFETLAQGFYEKSLNEGKRVEVKRSTEGLEFIGEILKKLPKPTDSEKLEKIRIEQAIKQKK